MARTYIDCRTAEAIEPGTFYNHPNATIANSCSEGCCASRYHCPDCGTTWGATHG